MSIGRPCTVCSHPLREEIDQALVGASVPVRTAARHYDLCHVSVLRHAANHIPALLADAREAEAAALAEHGESLLADVRDTRAKARTWHDRAEAINTEAAKWLATELESVEAFWDAEEAEAASAKKPPTARQRRELALGRAGAIAAARRRWAADVDGATRLGLAAVRELRGVLKLLGLTTGELRQEPQVQVNVLVQSITAMPGDQRLTALRELATLALAELPPARQERARALLAEAFATPEEAP